MKVVNQENKIRRQNKNVEIRTNIGNGLYIDLNKHVVVNNLPADDYNWTYNLNLNYTIVMYFYYRQKNAGINNNNLFSKPIPAPGAANTACEWWIDANDKLSFRYLDQPTAQQFRGAFNWPLITPENFYKVVVVRNGLNSVDVHINGVKVPNWAKYFVNTLKNGVSFNNTSLFRIGTGLFTYRFSQINMYHLSFWQTAFTDTQALNFDYTPNYASNLVAMWDFNHNRGNTLRDVSNNGYDGTLTHPANEYAYNGGAWLDHKRNNAL